jgi:nucleotide-binding universal stress UspA family protein
MTIVVGYDGSRGSERALRWAVREADARGTDLTACLVWAPDSLAPEDPEDEALATQRASGILGRGLGHARARLGQARVRQLVASGPPAQVLCEQSAAAEMVVVGARGHSAGHGDRTDSPLGPVAWQLAGHGLGRIVVVRGALQPANRTPGPIVVGVDGSAAAQSALPFAFEEAALRDVPLFAVCATADAAGSVVGGAHRIEQTFSSVITEQEKAHPDVTVVRHVSPGSPRAALLTAAADAQLLVLGARGRGGLPGMSLGSVAHVALLHAPCSVAVIRLFTQN